MMISSEGRLQSSGSKSWGDYYSSFIQYALLKELCDFCLSKDHNLSGRIIASSRKMCFKILQNIFEMCKYFLLIVIKSKF